MIRKFEDKDVDAVVSSWRRATELAHPFLSTEFLKQESSNVRNVYVIHAEIWVTEIDGVVIGFIALIDDEERLQFGIALYRCPSITSAVLLQSQVT